MAELRSRPVCRFVASVARRHSAVEGPLCVVVHGHAFVISDVGVRCRSRSGPLYVEMMCFDPMKRCFMESQLVTRAVVCGASMRSIALVVVCGSRHCCARWRNGLIGCCLPFEKFLKGHPFVGCPSDLLFASKAVVR